MEINRVLPILKFSGRIADGRIFLIEPPTNIHPEILTSAKREDSNQWSSWRVSNYEYLKENLAGLKDDSTIIDLGAGQISYKKLITNFPNYIGVDFYPYEGVSVIADFTRELPFKDATADAVIISNVLEHIPTPELFLRECMRILKPGGKIIGTVPFVIKIHQEPYDFLRYTHFMLERLFKNADFIKVEIMPLGSPANTYAFAQNFLFGRLIKESRGISKILIKIAITISKSITAIFWPLYKRVTPSKIFPEGYGFKAYK